MSFGGVNPGKYRHRVHIQEPVDVRDSETGAISREWETVYLDSDTPLDSVPAEVLTGPGRETHAAGTKLASVDARIQMRWFPGLLPTMRILWDGEFDSELGWTGKIFDIIEIGLDATARREYRLAVKDGLSDGT